MTFPFKITQDIIDAYQEHEAYTSAGQAWLVRNDPQCKNEEVLLEQIITQIDAAAQEHFGDDEDAYYEFRDEVGLQYISSGDWYDTVAAELESAK